MSHSPVHEEQYNFLLDFTISCTLCVNVSPTTQCLLNGILMVRNILFISQTISDDSTEGTCKTVHTSTDILLIFIWNIKVLSIYKLINWMHLHSGIRHGIKHCWDRWRVEVLFFYSYDAIFRQLLDVNGDGQLKITGNPLHLPQRSPTRYFYSNSTITVESLHSHKLRPRCLTSRIWT